MACSDLTTKRLLQGLAPTPNPLQNVFDKAFSWCFARAGGAKPALERVRAAVRFVLVRDAPVAVYGMTPCVVGGVDNLPYAVVSAWLVVEKEPNASERCRNVLHGHLFRS